jgi:hypothetical protein
MITSEVAEDHIRAWLTNMIDTGRIELHPNHRTPFADVYALYRTTNQGERMGTTFFSLYLSLNGLQSVNGTGNKAYKVGLRILDESAPTSHNCTCGRRCWGPAS